MMRVGIAMRAVTAGEPAKAASHLVVTLALARRTDLWFLEELSLLTLVFAGIATGDFERAVRLHGALHDAETMLRERLTPGAIAAYDRALMMAEQSLGEAGFARLTGNGRLVRWPDAVTLGEQIAAAIAHADEVDIDLDDGDQPDPSDGAANGTAVLTSRELEVLGLIASGHSNKEIASTMQLRPKTVMHHTSNIYRKLGVRGRTQAVAAAWRLGLLTADAQEDSVRPQ
jgi:DNA-binding CsgD family transcriptional regulator